MLKYVISDRSLTDVIRVVALDVMCDRSLAEKALLVEVFLLKLISVGTTRETSRANVEAMEGSKTDTIKRVQEINTSWHRG